MRNTACFVMAFGNYRNCRTISSSEVILESCLKVAICHFSLQGSISHSIVVLLSLFCTLFCTHFIQGSFICFIPITEKDGVIRGRRPVLKIVIGKDNIHMPPISPPSYRKFTPLSTPNFELYELNTRSVCLSATLIITLSFLTSHLLIINPSGVSYYSLVSLLYSERTAKIFLYTPLSLNLVFITKRREEYFESVIFQFIIAILLTNDVLQIICLLIREFNVKKQNLEVFASYKKANKLNEKITEM